MSALLEVRDLQVSFRSEGREIRAVRGELAGGRR